MSTGCLRSRAWFRLSADTSLVLAGPSLSVTGPSDRSPSGGAVTSQVCCVLGRSSVGWMGQVSHRVGCTQGYTVSPLHSEPTLLAMLCPHFVPLLPLTVDASVRFSGSHWLWCCLTCGPVLPPACILTGSQNPSPNLLPGPHRPEE